MIDVKEAVGKAVAFLTEVSLSPPQDLMVEAVERSGDVWTITLGWRGERLVSGSGKSLATTFGLGLDNNVATIAHPEFVRAYRTFSVNSETGEVEDMSMRNEQARVW